MSAMSVNRITQRLGEEHRATVSVMERLAALITSQRREAPEAGGGSAASHLLRELAGGVESEVMRHFDFEEQSLFALLEASGEAEIGAHLTEEHAAMRPLWERLAALARAGATAGFGEAGWSEFQRVGLELCERMLAHIQKEDIALLPLIEDSMDAETEQRLYDLYVANA
jgi:hemerythrin-like domain-containing protein